MTTRIVEHGVVLVQNVFVLQRQARPELRHTETEAKSFCHAPSVGYAAENSVVLLEAKSLIHKKKRRQLHTQQAAKTRRRETLQYSSH